MLKIVGLKPTMNLEAERQFETSIGLSEEGPWIALTDWVHSVSAWLPPEQNGDDQFTVRPLSGAEANKFSKFDKKGFLKAVRTKTKEPRWSKLASQSTTPTNSPC